VNTVSNCEGRGSPRCSFCMQVQVRLLPDFASVSVIASKTDLLPRAGVVRALLLAPSAPLDEPSALSDLSSALNLVILGVQNRSARAVRNTPHS